MVILNQVTPITVADLNNATTLTGNEYLSISQANASVKLPISSLPQGMTAGVVVYGNTGGAPFPNYRTLAAGSGIVITDDGAHGNLTLKTNGATGSFTAGGHTLTIVNGIITSIS